MKINRFILILIFSACTLTACGIQNPLTMLNAPTPVQNPNPGKATITGKVISTITKKPLKTTVWLAEVYRHDNEAIYLFDSVNTINVFSDQNGLFVISNVDPKEYVIIVGNPEGKDEVIEDQAGNPKVWKIQAGQIFNTGELKVGLTK